MGPVTPIASFMGPITPMSSFLGPRLPGRDREAIAKGLRPGKRITSRVPNDANPRIRDFLNLCVLETDPGGDRQCEDAAMSGRWVVAVFFAQFP